MNRLLASILIAGVTWNVQPVQAASLQVAPVTLEVPSPAATATLRLTNSGSAPINAQIRVYKWALVDGRDKLVPTRDVVASPPFARLEPGRRNIIRVVRVSKAPRRAEETYRLLVDELPSAQRRPGVAVNFVLRHSIPVFFSDARRRPEKVQWTATKTRNGLRIAARNLGDRRLRISKLKIVNASGQTLAARNGLLGYALGQSTAQWTMPGAMPGVRDGSEITITADGDNGQIRTRTKVRARN